MEMTQEQRITRGSVIIFILSIMLLACLCLTATLAYFAGQQKSDMVLILGGPVRITIHDRNNHEKTGDGNLVMNVKTNREELLPGMGIDMQAIAHITSSGINPTKALIRARLDVSVVNAGDFSGDVEENAKKQKEVEEIMRKALADCLTYRIENVQDGWVMFDDGNYYYCSKTNYIDESTHQQFIQMKSIATSDEGNNVPFINGTFQLPTKYYTNRYAHFEIILNLRFEAIQEVLVDQNGDRIPNTIFNVKDVLDTVDWEKHND